MIEEDSIFTPTLSPVQDFEEADTEKIKSEPQSSSAGTVKVELPKIFYKTGHNVEGKVTIKMNGGPKDAESLIVAVWGQKVVNVPPALRNQGEDGRRVVYISQRSAELSGKKRFEGEETFEFKLPIVAPLPDIAANYKWYVGASLMLADKSEIVDVVEIKVAD